MHKYLKKRWCEDQNWPHMDFFIPFSALISSDASWNFWRASTHCNGGRGVMSNTVDHIWITYIPKMLLRISLQLMSSMQFYLWVINSSESSLSWSYLETKSPSFTSCGQLLTEPQTQPVNFQVGYFYGRLDKLNRSDTDSFKFIVFYWRPKEICEWFLVLGHKLLECKPYPQETDI